MNETHKIHVALVGNPNTGKSTLFNLLTGARQHVGNYPGVTVEKKEGFRTFEGWELEIVDLPGTYSLNAYSEDEEVTRRYLLEHIRESQSETSPPFVVVDVLDASNPQRNLYLALQIRELGIAYCLVFNMMDIAQARGYTFDFEKLSQRMNAPIIPMIGTQGENIPELLRTVVEISQQPRKMGQLSSWESKKTDTDDVEQATRRYDLVTEICQETMHTPVVQPGSFSDKLDHWFLNRYLGIPLFLLMMYLVFQLTFTLGAYPMEWIEAGFGMLGTWINSLWPEGSESLLRSLIVDGIIGGVGGVIIFLPNILLLFLAISLLEDSGYMARAAFLMDHFMSKIGLHGKSFIPMLIGFGCSVPAIMATRTLENRRERLATMFIIPLMSCGARLPIYALLIPAFFPPAWNAPVLWMLYCIGILLAVFLAKILRTTILKSEPIPFIMELPPYHVPTVRTVGIRTLERGWLYLKKAGTIILGISILLWGLTTFPQLPKSEVERFEEMRASVEDTSEIDHLEEEEALANSCAGRVGKVMEPVLRPMGFDWKIGTALVGAVAAKEVFVAQMGIVYKIGEADEESESLRNILQKTYSPLTGFCIMLFCLISAPCMATFAVMARESGSWKWAIGQWSALTCLAWVITTIVYQLGVMFHLGV